MSGWLNGLRRCVQVAVYSVGVGLNPSSVNTFLSAKFQSEGKKLNIFFNFLASRILLSCECGLSYKKVPMEWKYFLYVKNCLTFSL